MALLPAGLVAADPESASSDTTPPTDILDLGVLEVEQERWTYEQEVTMRMIRNAYDRPRSRRIEKRDHWTCWIEGSARSRAGYLYCARNGDILANRPNSIIDTPELLGLGYGTYLVSTSTVNRGRFENLLESFRGGEAFNDEFLSLVMAGERPPRDLPTDDELSRYAAWERGNSDPSRQSVSLTDPEAEWRAVGLSAWRAERIRLHLSTYESVRARYRDLSQTDP